MKRYGTVLLLIFSLGFVSCSRPKILYESDSSLLTSTVYVVVKTGSLADPKEKPGLSYLLSELILRGTKTKTRSEFQRQIEHLGGSLGVSASPDTINFVGSVITENTDAFVDLMEEALLNPKFDEKELENLRIETLAEIAHAKNRNTRIGGLALRKRLFQGTKMEYPTVGSIGSVRAINREEIVSKYKNDFVRKNVFFAVASAMEEKKLSARLTKMWKRFPKGKAASIELQEANLPPKPELILVHKPKTATGSILMATSGMKLKDPERYSLGIGNFSFGGEPLVSRLFKIVRSEKGWTYAIGSSYNSLGGPAQQKGIYMIYATPSIEFTTKTVLHTLKMWNEYRTGGLKEDEIMLAKDSLVNSYPFEFDSPRKRLALKADSYLYDIPILDPPAYESKIRGISNQKIIESVKKFHPNNNWVITIVADESVIKKQLAEEQKLIPEEQRLKIAKVINPDDVIQ